MQIFRLLKIFRISWKFGLDEILLTEISNLTQKYLSPNFDNDKQNKTNFTQNLFLLLIKLIKKVQFWRDFSAPRGKRIRLALENLGTIFVKFGQMLSTRRDLIPTDIADELAKLQDQVQAIPPQDVVKIIQKAYKKNISEIFSEFDEIPLASASVAQVHSATLKNLDKVVAVKILRPNIISTIEKDLKLLETFAGLLESLWNDAKRLKPKEVVAEFSKYLHDELDLMREAANASQLRRNFIDSDLLIVPEVFWDFCTPTVMVMQKMHGVPISQTQKLIEQNINLEKLSEMGVEIFFTQVFRDGFFHADMHPGNIFVADDGRYIALDFGIVATLTDEDKHYLAQNFLAFFRRDYKRVAEVHIESGWAPPTTRVDEFESAIRAVCEPVFDRPLKDISFGKVLLRLFQTSRRFHVEIQPQLIMLQKTLLNIEGLGRELNPNLDLWKTAKPFLENWTAKQIGWEAFKNNLWQELPNFTQKFPKLPNLLYQTLQMNLQQNSKLLAANENLQRQNQLIMQKLLRKEKIKNSLFFVLLVVFVALILLTLPMFLEFVDLLKFLKAEFLSVLDFLRNF